MEAQKPARPRKRTPAEKPDEPAKPEPAEKPAQATRRSRGGRAAAPQGEETGTPATPGVRASEKKKAASKVTEPGIRIVRTSRATASRADVPPGQRSAVPRATPGGTRSSTGGEVTAAETVPEPVEPASSDPTARGVAIPQPSAVAGQDQPTAAAGQDQPTAASATPAGSGTASTPDHPVAPGHRAEELASAAAARALARVAQALKAQRSAAGASRTPTESVRLTPGFADEPPTDLPYGVHRRKRPAPQAAEVLDSGPVVLKTEAEWEHFAPEPPGPPARPVLLAGRFAQSRVGRVLRHEWTLAGVAALILTLLVNWPVLIDPVHTVPGGLADSAGVAYVLAWGGHALLTDPAAIWHLNAYYPTGNGLAFGDSLLGYAPLGMIGSGPDAAVLRFSIVYLLAQALAFLGAYALARQLGVGRVAGAVAGVAFAFAPWRLGQDGHLEMLSIGGIALALAMLCRGHGWRLVGDEDDRPPERPGVKPGWALAGWLVGAWQLSLGWSLGLVFAYVLAGVAAVGLIWWAGRRRGWPGWRLLVADGVGAVAFVSVGVLLTLPYQRAAGLSVLDLPGTPDWGAYVTAPGDSLLWGDRHAGARARLDGYEHLALLPGFMLYGLAAAGLVYSIWSLRTRVLLVAGVVASMAIGLGEAGPGDGGAYGWFQESLPGLAAQGAPYRLIVWTTLLLALLAAGAVAALARRAGAAAEARGLPRPDGWARFAVALPLILILLEGLCTGPGTDVPVAPRGMADLAGPILVLPSDGRSDPLIALWSTDGFPALVNGSGRYVPEELAEARREVAAFPDRSSADYLRRLGVRTVLVLPDRVAGTPWEGAATRSVDGLEITREERSGALVFRLG